MEKTVETPVGYTVRFDFFIRNVFDYYVIDLASMETPNAFVWNTVCLIRACPAKLWR
jgi:hypothetical protein